LTDEQQQKIYQYTDAVNNIDNAQEYMRQNEETYNAAVQRTEASQAMYQMTIGMLKAAGVDTSEMEKASQVSDFLLNFAQYSPTEWKSYSTYDVCATALGNNSADKEEVFSTAKEMDEEIQKNIEVNERTLVTTLTKKMAEELDDYFHNHGIHSAYIHSVVDTLDRVKLMDQLRAGAFDVLVGVNLLREGLDLPEVSLVAILDADKEGFLRNERSLTQTIGRAARNVHGRAIMYADRITGSMQRTIDETERRRLKQMRYNEEHGITPRQIKKKLNTLLDNEELKLARPVQQAEPKHEPVRAVADSNEVQYHSLPFLEAEVARTKEKMMAAAKALDFMEAAHLRDYMLMLQERIEKMNKGDKGS
jgi:excinuclease ABC subunit B